MPSEALGSWGGAVSSGLISQAKRSRETFTIAPNAGSYKSGSRFRHGDIIGQGCIRLSHRVQSTRLENVAMGSAKASSATLLGNVTIHGASRAVNVLIKASLDSSNHISRLTATHLQLHVARGKARSMFETRASDDVAGTYPYSGRLMGHALMIIRGACH